MKQNSNTEIRPLWARSIPYILIGILSVAMLWPVIKSDAYVGGLDSYFHMNSFYEAAMQIKHFRFSYFISLFGFDQSGRIVNAVYGPLFNYLMGGLLLLCGTWTRFNILMSILVLFACGSGMYTACRVVNVRMTFATVLAGCYMITHQVLSWVGNQEFTGISAAIIPFAFIVGLHMAKRKTIPIAECAIIMTVALQIHMLTALISSFILVIFFLYASFRVNNVKKFYEHGIMLAIGTAVLNLNIFAGLIEVLCSNDIIPTYPQAWIQKSGATIQTFGFGTLGLLFVMLVLFLVFKISKKATSLSSYLLFVCILFMFISSAYFPWNSLCKSIPQVENVIQFPQRFMPVFWCSLYVLVGIYLTRFSDTKNQVIYPYISWIVLIAAIVPSIKPVYNYLVWLPKPFYRAQVIRYINSVHYMQHDPKVLRRDFHSHDLTTGVKAVKKSTPDYMPSSKSINTKNYMTLPIYNRMLNDVMAPKMKVHKTVKNHQLAMTWRAKRVKTVALPAVKYAHTRVVYEGRVIHPKINVIGAIKLKQHPGVNHMSIKYIPSLAFRISIALMIAGWLMVIAWYVFIIFL